ncbi:hypothetical protein Tco_0300214 [Tanacetum coccineum]
MVNEGKLSLKRGGGQNLVVIGIWWLSESDGRSGGGKGEGGDESSEVEDMADRHGVSMVQIGADSGKNHTASAIADSIKV